MVGKPSEAVGPIGDADGLQGEGRAGEVAAGDRQFVTEDVAEVGDDPVVRGRGGGKEARLGGEAPEEAFHLPVLGTEIVAPVGDAVCLVDDNHADARGDGVKDGGLELGVREAFGGDEKDVDLMAPDPFGHLVPIILVG